MDPKASPAPSRITALDALRGLAMVIMALDHVRDFFHDAAFSFQPDDLRQTTVALFFTRWMTHFCAPVFMFAAGAGAYLWGKKGRSPAQLSSYLLKRGLWLVLLELTALRFALNINVFSGPVLLTVLWALGWSMVALSVGSRLPPRLLAAVSLSLISLHHLADAVSLPHPLWKVVHQQGAFVIGGIVVVAGYPLIPWIAVMAAGFCLGPVLQLDPPRRDKVLIRLGAGLILMFAGLRALNLYGDPQPWSPQPSAVWTVLSFLRVTKYPPSLDFLLMTLGPALLLLAWFYRHSGRGAVLATIGRVPLFYFLGHMLLVQLLTFPFAWFRYGQVTFLLQGRPSGYPADYGYPLWTVYAVWIAVVAAMYPLCVWFGRLKATRRGGWIAYF